MTGEEFLKDYDRKQFSTGDMLAFAVTMGWKWKAEKPSCGHEDVEEFMDEKAKLN